MKHLKGIKSTIIKNISAILLLRRLPVLNKVWQWFSCIVRILKYLGHHILTWRIHCYIIFRGSIMNVEGYWSDNDTPCNVFQFPCQRMCLTTRQLFHPFQQLKSFPTLPNTHTCPPSTTRSCPGASTGAEHLWLRQASFSLCTVSTSRPRAWKMGWAGVIRQR